MKAFFAALQFLTILPLPASLTGDEKSLAKSVRFFPLVGLLVGALVAATDLLLQALLPPLAATCLTVFFLIAITGGLHMDGLADTADGFFSARTRPRMLEIMRDSRIGAMGVMAIVFVVALKVAALTSLSMHGRLGVLVLMPLAGRSAIILMMTALPYARPDGGLAAIFLAKRSWWTPVAAFLLLGIVGWGLGRGLGLFAALAALAAAALLIRYTLKKIGGFTGDTLGAVSEMTEMMLALSAAAWVHVGV